LSKIRFSYRRYQDGDAEAINELYFQVTGRRRTVAQHAWQWLQSPAGESEMWLIEAELPGGEKKLIGHHGVMAELFSYYGQTLRVGKTENTMVLADYREKLLYPRFEKIFMAHYEAKFHALFSTIGPEPAIRLRKAMGYVSNHAWVQLYLGNEPSLSINLLREHYKNSSANLTDKLVAIGPVNLDGVIITCLDKQLEDFDFDDYWASCSPHYGLTPARTHVNLHWRFWSNPYYRYHTIKLDDPLQGTAIAIISLRAGHMLYVDDLYCRHIETLGHFMRLLHKWASQNLSHGSLRFSTTADSIRHLAAIKLRSFSWIHQLTRRSKNLENIHMPRKVTSLGVSAGVNPDEDWYVTPFYFEGR
jgi:hypothetical protein